MTTKMGRPSTTKNDGFHRHEGGMRWHSILQKHHVVLHGDVPQHGVPPILIKARDEFGANKEILLLLKEIEDGMFTADIMNQLGEIIGMLLSYENIKERPQGSEPIGDSEEPREVNTIGLP